MKKTLNALALLAIEKITFNGKVAINHCLVQPFLKSITSAFIICLLLFGLQTKAQQNIVSPTPNIRTAPAGSLVIAMDNVLQANSNGDFNLKSYGLIVRLLNANKKMNWVIRAGKAKDGIDFTAPAERVYPTAEAAASRNFIGGPFVIYAQDTAGVGQIVTTFNNTLSTGLRVKVYRLSSAAQIDVRYELFQPVITGIMDEGGAYGVHEGYMVAASIPTTNYEATNRLTVNSKCYTFVSEPHNGNDGPWIDSVRQYILRGGNFLAECAAIITYENYAPAGRFQTTGGYDNVNIDINNEVVFPQPDLSYIQVHGIVKPKIGGNTQTYSLNPGSTTKNDWSATTRGSTSHPEVYGATVSDMLPNSLGGLVFYLGNHEYKADTEEGINGIRMFFSAMLTPSSNILCPSNITQSPVYNPDINVTYVNVPVPGNVQTNDVVPSGTAYGTPVALSGNPAGGNITMNTDGTYSFVSPNVGVYRYNVPVCVPGQAAPCPTTLLTITVLGPNSNNNPPVANTDIATTKLNTAVTLKSLANDYAGNPGGTLNPFTVVVTVNPLHGTYTVNNSNGDITYTPATGYSGMDTLTYRVCDNTTPTALCATALQIITIKAAGAPNSTAAADDYVFTPINTAVTGNAMTNDTDPEGNSQSITAQTTTIAGKGTLVLNSNGTFTFTPVSGFSGPVNFAYTTTDNGSPVATAKATIYILVSPAPSSTNPDFNSTFVNVPVPGNVSTNDRVPAGTSYGTSPTLLSSPAGSTPTLAMNANGTYTFVSNIKGVYIYDVPVCMPGQTAPCPPTKLTITVLDAGGVTNSPVANVDIAVTRINTPVTLRSLANDAAGNPSNMLVPSSVTVTVAPLHGTATVNAATGDITYTPAAGYTGTDTLTYQVCDDQFSPKCATANQIITIMPLGAPNTTEAADDYKITAHNTVATGNVKINDTDPEGNTQTVTAQNTTVAGKGTLVLGTNGDYTFTPVTGFSGPVDFTYTTCDNGIPQACATATLHILVRPASGLPDLTPSIFNDGTTLNRNTTRDNVIRIFNIGPGATTAPITFTIPKMLPAFEITINPNETMVDVFGGMPVTNNQWTIVEQASRYVFTSKPGVVIASGAFNDIGLKVKAVGIVNSTGNLSIQIVFGTGGGETPFNNNSDNNTYSIN